MKIYKTSDPEKEGVLGRLFEVFGSIWGGFWEAKSRKKALRNQVENGCDFWCAFGFKSGGPAECAERLEDYF